jgi:hypothetical protein
MSLGTELTFTNIGIVNGSTKEERVKQMEGKTGDDYPLDMRDTLNSVLERIKAGVEQNFGGKKTYCSAMGERFAVNWEKLKLDIIAPHLYTWNWLPPNPREWMRRVVERLSPYGKVYASEFGCLPFRGAADDEDYHGQSYSQEEQARNIIDSVDNMEAAGIRGINPWSLVYKGVPDVDSYGILRWKKNSLQRRNLGFDAYRSYVVE